MSAATAKRSKKADAPKAAKDPVKPVANVAALVKTCQRVGTPLVAVNTSDPAATIKAICTTLDDEAPRIEWDLVRGLVGRNDSGRAWIAELGDVDETQFNPTALLMKVAKLPEESVLFAHMSQRWINEHPCAQALWNLRDQFKINQRVLVLLGKQITLPTELSDDVMTFDEPLPTEDELAGIVEQQHRNAGLTVDQETTPRAVEALRGLSAFAAEQVTAMSLTKNGVRLDDLWERKRQQIEQTPGLKVYRGDSSFDRIGGCYVIKGFLSRIMGGNARPNAVVFVDEIEKFMAGQGDTSGVSQDQLGSILAYMQDTAAAGVILVGPPGAAKSEIAKAAGNAGGVPTIQLDLGGMKGSLVGQSEQQLRQALKIITAVSNGQSLWIATCNAISSLPPELRRRFTLGTYFFDLPTESERTVIWQIWRKRYQLDDVHEKPNDESWTGAEIKQCCDISWRLNCSLKEAAAFVVPVARSAPDKLAALRDQANGRFLSASYPGVYQIDPKQEKLTSGRAIKLEV